MARNEDRLHALDAVRAGALLLGVVFHAAMSFVPGIGVGAWATADRSPSVTLGVVVFVSHTFRMTLFYLIAGFFARLLIERRGTRGFWMDRAKRILAPMIVGWLLIFPWISWVWAWGTLQYYHGLPAPPRLELAPPSRLAFPMTHLWFLYVLLLLYAVVVPLRVFARRLDRDGRLHERADFLVGWLVRSGSAAVVLALPIALLLAFQRSWFLFGGLPTPERGFDPPLPSFVCFLAAFSLGWLVHRNDSLLAVWRGSWPLHLVAGVAATVACLWQIGLVPVMQTTSDPTRKLSFAVPYALSIWCWTFALLGLALRFFANESRVRRYVADASYWIYLVHLPLVAEHQVLVSQLPLSWTVKFPVVLAATLGVLFVSYQLFVRHTFIGRVLNGRTPSRVDQESQTLALQRYP
jgi:peptidoglycan/LPS O-acetylase OafA/YrhL